MTHVVERFAFTAQRAQLIHNLIDYRKALYAAGITDGLQWINGSFVEHVEARPRPGKAPRPDDIDLVTFYHPPGQQTPETHDLFRPSATRPRFNVDGYGIPLGVEFTADDVEAVAYWYGMWSLRACLRSLQYVKLRLLPEGVIMSHSYSSDISREQFARILPCLESARRRTKPRTVDLYDVFCGVLYLLKSGCQWRMLPADFPDWRTCYKYFRQWSERPDPAKYSILEQVLKKIGWRGPAKQWSERTDQLLYRGLPERQEHRQRREQGL